jgi:serine/threonine protein kinase
MDPLDHSQQIGETISGYKLLSVLGQGSFAVVYLATDGFKQYAVKCLYKMGLSDSQLKLQMEEAGILQSLSHPNIITLHQVIQTQDCVYLVLDYCKSDLFDAIMSNDFTESDSKLIFSQLCHAVAACHSSGVYHRDIKPENILLDGLNVKLTDFGLATRSPVSSDFGCGSIRYMAPECLGKRFKSPYSCAANDVWALGIILINILTGKNPWVEPSFNDKHYNSHLRANSFSRIRANSTQDSFKQQFGFTDDLCRILRLVFSPNQLDRPSPIELSKMVTAIPFLLEHNVSPLTPEQSDSTLQETPFSEDLMFEFDDHQEEIEVSNSQLKQKRQPHVHKKRKENGFSLSLPSPPTELSAFEKRDMKHLIRGIEKLNK